MSRLANTPIVGERETGTMRGQHRETGWGFHSLPFHLAYEEPVAHDPRDVLHMLLKRAGAKVMAGSFEVAYNPVVCACSQGRVPHPKLSDGETEAPWVDLIC